MKIPILKTKTDLIKWISNLEDLKVLSELIELKEKNISVNFVAEAKANSKDNFDQQFAAAMTSEELFENITAHLENLPEND
ncbi:hypothetical protein [Halpernia sp.]|uniref:hypothetical protein n=1 Tax=Halpernia sp. TaxID=2782209 RepID=UPI003A8F4B88